jgi:hypothetical protein
MVRTLAAAVVMAALPGAGVASSVCLQADKPTQTVEGRLTSSRFTTPAYRLSEQAYILRLRSPACLEGAGDYDKVEKTDRVHVYSMDAAMLKRMRGLIGKTVRITGSAFGEHTAHHHAPIVMSVATIERTSAR